MGIGVRRGPDSPRRHPPTSNSSHEAMITLEALGNLGEFVGALGVVISLIYLAQQMRQNTTSVRAASFNSMVQNSIRLLEHSFRDSEFAAFLARAEQNPHRLSRDEQIRWDSYMTAVYRHFGNLIYQHRVGALDTQMWESYDRTLTEHLRTPSWGEWFVKNQGIFSTALVEAVHHKLEQIEREGSAHPAPARETAGAHA
jgi:hypothetical protein